MTSEEDPELFLPIISTLKQDYDKGVQMLVAQGIPQQERRE